MIYTPLTLKAMQIAYKAHHGQTDKAGAPYIFHPMHLAEQMNDEFSVCAALLHDVAEDTDITLDELAEDFPERVIAALRLLTHQPDTDYFDYIRALRSDEIAAAVKLADLRHNSDAARLCGKMSERDEKRFRKYAEAIAILTENE